MEAGLDNANATNNPFTNSNGSEILAQKDGLLHYLNEGYKPNGASSEFFLDRSANGKRTTEDFDDDEDLGPETDVDAVDDVLLSPTKIAEQSVNNNAFDAIPNADLMAKVTLETEMNLQKHEADLLEGEKTPREETPTPPADEVHDAGLVDNVAESGEDSEDEWNYYKGDTADKENISPSQPDREVAAIIGGESEDEENMSQLNPDAAEFVPISPTRVVDSPVCRALKDDTVLAQSPVRGIPNCELDINLPNPAEFQNEVKNRPSGVFSNGHDNGHKLSSQEIMENLLNGKNIEEIEFQPNSTPVKGATDEFHFGPNATPFSTPSKFLDQSEALSTKANFGDDSTASYMEKTSEISISDNNPFGDQGDNPDFQSFKKEQDPMSMSFYQEKEDMDPFDLDKVQVLPDNIEDFIGKVEDTFDDTISDLPEHVPLENADMLTTDLDKHDNDDMLGVCELPKSPLPATPEPTLTENLCAMKTPEPQTFSPEPMHETKETEECAKSPQPGDLCISPLSLEKDIQSEVYSKSPNTMDDIAVSPQPLERVISPVLEPADSLKTAPESEICPKSPVSIELETKSPEPVVCMKSPEPVVCMKSPEPVVCMKSPEPAESPEPQSAKSPECDIRTMSPKPDVCPKSPLLDIRVQSPELVNTCAKTPEPEMISPEPEICTKSPIPQFICGTLNPLEEVNTKTPEPQAEVVLNSPEPTIESSISHEGIASPEPSTEDPISENAFVPLEECSLPPFCLPPFINPEEMPEQQVRLECSLPLESCIISPLSVEEDHPESPHEDVTSSMKDDEPLSPIDTEAPIQMDQHIDIVPLEQESIQSHDEAKPVTQDIVIEEDKVLNGSGVQEIDVERWKCVYPLPRFPEVALENSSDLLSPQDPPVEPKTDPEISEEPKDSTLIETAEAAAAAVLLASAAATAVVSSEKAEDKKALSKPKTSTTSTKKLPTKPTSSPTKASSKPPPISKMGAKALATAKLSSSAKPPLAKSSLSPKPAPAKAPVPKPKAPIAARTSAERKPISNGDTTIPKTGLAAKKPAVPSTLAKSLPTPRIGAVRANPTKPTVDKVASAKTSTPTSKLSTTSTLKSTTAPKPRPNTLATKTAAAKSPSTATKTTPILKSTSSPRTAAVPISKPKPASAPAAPKPRVSLMKTTAKAPDAEKQNKENVNKLTASRTSAASKTTTLGSTTNRTSTARKMETKPISVPKAIMKTTSSTRTSIGTKKTIESVKNGSTKTTKTTTTKIMKPKENGIPNGVTTVTEITTVNITSNDVDEQLIKDLSPVENNLIIDNSQVSETTVAD